MYFVGEKKKNCTNNSKDLPSGKLQRITMRVCVYRIQQMYKWQQLSVTEKKILLKLDIYKLLSERRNVYDIGMAQLKGYATEK